MTELKFCDIIIKDKNGFLHKLKPSSLLNGNSSPSIVSAIDKESYSIYRFREVHGYKFQYPDFIYCGTKCKFTVVCELGHTFERTPNDHINGVGCPFCKDIKTGNRRRSNLEEFIEKSVERWGHDPKIYDKAIYSGAKDKLLILCEIHNEYYPTTPNDHLTGYGCPICGLENGGHGRESYCRGAKERDGHLYIIKCFNEHESFYKIGITYLSIKKRFRTDTIPYKYEVVFDYICDAGCVWDLEKLHHRKYKHYKYLPTIPFAGQTECFNLNLPIEEIIKNLENNLPT